MSINTIKECIMNNATLTSLEKRVYIDYSTTNHSGKMEDIDSISTSALDNETCRKRAACPGTICEKCYAMTYLKMRKELREKTAVNTAFYTNYELTKKDIPLINAGIFRFESFGEVVNTLQVKNYFTIARANKHCTFVLWSKNLHIIEAAMREYHTRKPENMIIIQSSVMINRQDVKKYSFVDKIFTVYTKEYASENGIKINCGSRKCIDCRLCYTKNGTVFVNELKK